MEAAMGREPLRIMAVGAHPPDIIARAGGTLAKHARRGDIVAAVSLTDGTRHMNGSLAPYGVINAEAVAKLGEHKREEMRAACAALGVQETVFLGLRDSPLARDVAALRALSDAIRQFRPDVVFTHHPQETALSGHVDHGDAGDLTLRAYMLAMELGFESRLPPWVVNSIYLFDAAGVNMDGPGVGHLPRATLFVDISEVVAAKKAAMLEMPSMGYTSESVDAMLAQAKGREQLSGVAHAEGFCELHTPVVDYVERRTKGRWVSIAQRTEWQGLTLWPEGE
jgi:LmbE family N-acetylglucosaminyl deacetylase